MISMLGTWTAVGILLVPELVLAIIGFVTGDALWGWLALVVAAVLGTILLVIGVRVGGSLVDLRGPELLGSLQKQK